MLGWKYLLCLIFAGGLALAGPASAGHVTLGHDRLIVDGTPAPYLFGAEVQYFRARGDAGRNVPADKVNKLWQKLIDRVLEAHMNEVTLYVPWDFHEPVEGVFDFDGKLDLDHDGKPDYPSRNLRGFLSLLVRRGIRRIMIRPGPYINAEWGPTGFGAVPRWFLERYPQALAKSRTSGKPLTVTFGHPIFRSHVERWFEALYSQVLKDFIGPGKPVVFLQLDNETNYFWDSIYERDQSPLALERYRSFLREAYDGSISALQVAYGAEAASFDAIQPPTGPDDAHYPGKAWHYDWYLFHDNEIRDYYRFLRTTWEKLGVHEPDVLFTSCDSFNAADHGLLPRLDFRQELGLSLTTMNIYPKTAGSEAQSTLNLPMKAAHDAALISASHRQFYGTGGGWVMSTETMGGWFPKWAEVSVAAREHTYGSLLGAGVKAMNIYYFHEGWNWDGMEHEDSELQFDAPLDKNLEPRPSFALLKSLGSALENGLGELVLNARPLTSPILLAHDSAAQYPLPGLPDALDLASTQSGALYGFLREAGFLPELGFVDRMTPEELQAYGAIVWAPPAYSSPDAAAHLQAYLNKGGTVISIGVTPLHAGASGKLVVLSDNPALGWNSDDYPKLPAARVTRALDQIRATLKIAGVAPLVEIAADGGLPFVHAWLSRSQQKILLFVENFQRVSRTVHLRLQDGLLAPAASYRAVRRWAGDESAAAVALAPATKPLQLPVSADGIDIWEIEPSL